MLGPVFIIYLYSYNMPLPPPYKLTAKRQNEFAKAGVRYGLETWPDHFTELSEKTGGRLLAEPPSSLVKTRHLSNPSTEVFGDNLI